MTKKLFAIILAVSLMLCLCSCSENKSTINNSASSDILKLSFKGASSFDYLKENNGRTVSIDGYLATSSPADGSFIFLMNLPFQSCPFCVPNTSQLSNTLECYPKKNQTFDYTNQAVRVIGTLEVAKDQKKGFSDMYGYEFFFKITDAEYTIISSDELSDEMKTWQKLADTNVINDVYQMYNYVSFLVSWPTYYVNSFTDENGNKQPGFYLYASDAVNYLEKENGQYHYGTEKGYFDNLIKRIEEVDPEAFSELVSNIKDAQQLANDAYAELKAEHYTYTYMYVENFESYDNVYELDKGDELCDRFNTIYEQFSLWLSNWEL